VPSTLSEKLTSGNQVVIEYNGSFYLKLDQADAAFTKELKARYIKNKNLEVVQGGFNIVTKKT